MLLDYPAGDVVGEAYVARPAHDRPRPCVLVAHTWAGISDSERAVADRLAAAGYVGLAIDVYGKGVRGDPRGGDNGHLMNPLLGNRARLRDRLLGAVVAARAMDGVDADRIAVIGYCFGGLCALDLARAGAPGLRGAVSIHGVYAPPALGPQARIEAGVLVLHGWEDPLAPPANVLALAAELTAAGADWQLHAYGHAAHAFTNPRANMPERGLAYHAAADRRSWGATMAFLGEVLG